MGSHSVTLEKARERHALGLKVECIKKTSPVDLDEYSGKFCSLTFFIVLAPRHVIFCIQYSDTPVVSPLFNHNM